jgi:FAD binding domain
MNHEEKVKIISEQIKSRAAKGGSLAFKKKSVSHVVPTAGKTKPEEKIYIGDLDQVLEIDEKNMTATAESGVTFADLVQKTLPHGLAPYVVPELKGITIGGAVSGCSIESMSYRFGGFHDSCLEYEVIGADGEIRVCSREHEAELFEMIHGSYGTLGLLSKIKFKLYPAKPFVKMTYEKHTDFDKFYSALLTHCEKADYTFIDAIIHAPDNLVICLGEYADTAPYVSNYEKENIFYKSTNEKSEDYLPSSDYFFRYDTECHWLSRAIPPLEWPTVRKLFSRFFLGSDNMIRWTKRLEKISLPIDAEKLPPVRAAEKILNFKKRPDVIVDVFVPSKKFSEFWAWYKNEFNFFPLWIVPYKMPAGIYPWISPSHARKTGENFIIDAAIYGKKNHEADRDLAKMLEEKVFELGGIKTLISKNYYTRERFAEIYNLELYNTIKQKTDPKNLFGTVYERMVK